MTVDPGQPQEAHYSYLYDGKGNPSTSLRACSKALIDGSQNVVASYAYDEFGNLVSETSTVEQPYKFSTKRYYDGIGLNYYGYRFYSPSLGRWMTRDPLGEAGGLNLYGFVLNNPIINIDPYGLHLWLTPAGGNRPHHHDPETGVAIAGWEDEIESSAKGWNEGLKNSTYVCAKAGAVIAGGVVTSDFGPVIGAEVWNWLDFLVDLLYGKPTTPPHFPIPDLINPPDASGKK